MTQNEHIDLWNNFVITDMLTGETFIQEEKNVK